MTAPTEAPRLGLSVAGRRWVMAPASPEQARELAAALGVSPSIGQILIARGITAVAAARAFLFGGREVLHDPFLLPDMEQAVAHLQEDIRAGRKICIYGDYDVDGVAATALLYRLLKALGADVFTYIPSRFDEGYGLNRSALEEVARGGANTVVTVDCGVTALDEAAYARELGLSLIITDHHEPAPQRPAALAVIDPKLPDSRYPFAGLSGTGVAFKLGLALAGEERADLVWALSDLAALATVADMVPLQDENRVLVKEGLARLNSQPLPGLAALAKVASTKRGELTEFHLAFALAPRINALGRLGSAGEALALLLAEDEQAAEELGRRLDEENRRRQAIEADIYKEALVQAQAQVDQGRRVLVLASPGWHIGVVGIVASRVTERFHRPTLMIGLEGEEGRGSGRSTPGFHLFQALSQCEDLLLRFGGHSQAAGLTLRAEHLTTLTERLEAIAEREMREEDLEPVLRVDGEVQPEEMTEETARQITLLAPFGLGNPSPMLALREVTVMESRPVGKEGTHLKLRLRAGRRTLDGIAFSLAEPAAAAGVAAGHQVDVAGVPELNEWNGRLRVQLKVRDIGQPLATPAAMPAAAAPVAAAASRSAATVTSSAAGPAPTAAGPITAPAQPRWHDAAALALAQADPEPQPPAGAHYLWGQALPRLVGSGSWVPWEGTVAPAEAAQAPVPEPVAGRAGTDPVAVLVDLARRGVPSVVVAATITRGLAFAAQAARQEPHLAASFLPYHGRLPAALRALVIAEFGQRNAPVLVTGWGGLAGLAPGLSDAVVLLDPPPAAADLRRAAELAAVPAGLVQQWDDAQTSLMTDILAAHCPDRQDLAVLYLFLKDLVRAGQAITVESAMAGGLPRTAVTAGLQVLAELGLLAEPAAGATNANGAAAAAAATAAAAWAWLPAGKGRLALESSAVFRDRQSRKQEFLRLLGYLSKVSPAARGRQVQ